MEKNVSWKYILSETKRIGLNYNKNYKINKQRDSNYNSFVMSYMPKDYT